MSDTHRIRKASPADADALIAGNQAMARETEDRELPAEQIGPGVRACLERPEVGADYWVAEAPDGQVVGQTMITREWSDWRNGWFWWIQSVYVPPEYRRHGVFRALYDAIREAAGREGDVIGIRLYVERENERARRTYEELGMSETDYALYEVDWSASPAQR